MTDKEREELAEAIGKGLTSCAKISAEDIQNENTTSYKMGEIKECDFEILSLLNFIDWFAPTKKVNDDLSKMVRHLAQQIDYTEREAKYIVDMGLKVMFVEGENYNPIQLEYYNKAKDFLKG